MKLRNQKGFTLIEIAIVLTIVGLIIGGIWLAASTVFTNNKTQALSTDIIQVLQNTKTLFAGQGSSATSAGFTEDAAKQAGIFPPDMISSSYTAAAPIIVTPFSTDNSVNAFTVTPGATAGQLIYKIGTATPNGLPSQACISLLTTLGSLNNMQKLGILKLAGTSAADLSAGGTAAVAPAAASAAGVCGAVGNANTITVTFSIS